MNHSFNPTTTISTIAIILPKLNQFHLLLAACEVQTVIFNERQRVAFRIISASILDLLGIIDQGES